ncbi:hypothetical protein IHE44_0008702 [Lamprotornis superbus]|uniref:TIR domain-containing protein n=1 Tax=Lamprotornis superbus TaxID=245042 RepID=A0A835TW39_9PASS|nr:hypothetical protein IHE44_0008702 [Lamprotornis superbus]
MAGWFRRLLHKPKPSSVESLKSSHSASSSPSSSSSSSAKSSSSSGTSLATSSISLSPVSAVDISASDSPRWDKRYDVCICHSEGDMELVEELVSYLEGQPESFRCFLQLRDAVAGSAVVTELCDAVQNSHCWVMLITPGFLQDPWCRYQMHQALAEAPMANGRTIPVLKDVDRKDYPRELWNLYYIYMALKEKSFKQIRDTVVRCEPPGTMPELHKKDRVVLGACRCIPMGIMELLLLDVPLDLEVKPELLRPHLGAKDGEFPTSMRDSRLEPTTSQWPTSPQRGQGHRSHTH